MDGWIKLHRSLIDNWTWKDKPFSKGQAWIDLLMQANYKQVKINVGLTVVYVERGQFLWSIKDIAERWGWSRKKVSSFLNVLESDGMLTQKRTTKYTVVTIVNYDTYQSKDDEEEHQSNNESTSQEHHGNTYKKEKKEKKVKNSYTEIADLYNSICISFPRIIKLSEARKKAINARLKTYSVEDFEKVFRMAQESDFLKGKNDKNWSATFDWMIKDSNMAKVLDGNYQNNDSKQSKPKDKIHNFQERDYGSKIKEMEQQLLRMNMEDNHAD